MEAMGRDAVEAVVEAEADRWLAGWARAVADGVCVNRWRIPLQPRLPQTPSSLGDMPPAVAIPLFPACR